MQTSAAVLSKRFWSDPDCDERQELHNISEIRLKIHVRFEVLPVPEATHVDTIWMPLGPGGGPNRLVHLSGVNDIDM